MRYSLIVPHYDDTRRLDRMLRSVPADRADVEILVVDDCSPDQDSLQVLRQRWPGVRWLSTAENAGAGAARNVGLSNAQGDYLIFADSDDEFLPGAFRIFDECITPETELAYFLAQGWQEADDTPSMRTEWINQLCHTFLDDPSDAALLRLKLCHVVPWAKVYSHQFIRNIGVRFQEVRFSNDVVFNVLAGFQARKVLVVPAPVYVCYRRPDSLTANPEPDAFLVRVGVQVHLAERLKAIGAAKQYRPAKSGPLLEALFAYGPVTAWRAWRLMGSSAMRPLELRKAVEPSLWLRFFKKCFAERTERRKAAERLTRVP